MLRLKHNNFSLLHFLFLPVFFIWHICNEYFGLIPASYWSKYLLYYISLSLFFFLFGILLFKNKSKSSIWAFTLISIFFFWGSFHDFLNQHLSPFLSSYKFLLSLIFILLILLGFRLKRKNSASIQQTNSFLSMLIFVLLSTEAAVSVYKILKEHGEKNNLCYYNKPISIPPSSVPDSSKPDIFFVIFDEYASSLALKSYLNYDNIDLDSTLLKNGFYIASKSKSNYNSTPFSLASTFSLDYFGQPLEKKKIFPKELLQAQHTLKQGAFPIMLKKHGYSIINHGLCDINGQPAPEEPLFNPDVRKILYQETFWGRIVDDIIWHVPFKIPSFILPNEELIKKENILRRNRNNFHNLLNELGYQTSQPKFVFAHIMMPHGRYYLNRKGEKRDLYHSDDHPAIKDSLYLDQLIYTNTWINSLASASNKKFSRPRVVILQGDHGRRDIMPYHPTLKREKQFMNLNCFYFSDKKYETLYDSISSVNTFRVVLNNYFHSTIPLLRDSTIRMQ